MLIAEITKRDGRKVKFDERKITDAIYKATKSIGNESKELAISLTLDVLKYLRNEYEGNSITVEDVQDIVETVLIRNNYEKLAKEYILYRDKRSRVRSAKSELMDTVAEILVQTHKENANISNSPSAKMLQIASAASKSFYLNRFIPNEYAQAHIRGDIHIHDLDFYGKTLTCLQIPLGKLLTTGFNNGHGFIRSPKRPSSATALAAIVLQSSQNDMHGGQSFAFFDRDMAPFMKNASKEDIFQAMEALIYNLNSMHSRAGAQVPFSSINLGTDTSKEGRLVTEALLLAYEKGLGRGENPIFPNIIFKVKAGVNFYPTDPNYDLFKLAIRVASTRLNPTFSFMDSSFNKPFGDQVAYMGCRTRTMSNVCGPEVTDGRGNLSFTTINLPRIAIKNETSVDGFYKDLSDMIDLVCDQLYHRYKVQAALKVKDMPFLMGQGLYLDSDKLTSEDTLESVVKHGTLSVGFIGLAETLYLLTGHHHGESEKSQRIGLEIIEYMRNKIDLAVKKYGLNYTLLATPAEGLSGRFVKIDRKEYGIINNVTNKEYYTNSFHVPVDCEISAYEKMKIEGAYHKFANAGHISYVEMSAPPVDNPDVLEDIIRHMYNCDIGYAGFNYPVDFCESCSYTGMIDGDECPSCGSTMIRRIRRITGYLSTVDNFNDAKKSELENRVSHIGG